MTEKDPFEVWKKAFLIGLGATAVTVERIQELANELVERGEMTQKEAMSFTDDLKARAKKEKDGFETKVKETVDSYMKQAVSSLGLVTREEFEAMKQEMGAKNGGSSSSTAKKAGTSKSK